VEKENNNSLFNPNYLENGITKKLNLKILLSLIILPLTLKNLKFTYPTPLEDIKLKDSEKLYAPLLKD